MALVVMDVPSSYKHIAAAAQNRAHRPRGPDPPARNTPHRASRTCTTVSTMPLSKACVAASTTCSVASSSASAPDLTTPLNQKSEKGAWRHQGEKMQRSSCVGSGLCW
jgi:hypothetical protein